MELIYFKYMKAKISYHGLQRIEEYFVTEASMREAILNAIVHKQYESGVPVQISIYKDKLYIVNIGKLPDNWSEMNLYEKHGSKPYNPNVANAFYLAGHIESWGRGIEKIFDSCRENDLPTPIYHVNPSDIMIQFNAPDRLVINNFVEVTDKVTDKEKEILALLVEDPGYTSTYISQQLSLNRKTVSLRIKSLKEKGIIVRIGSDRKGFWKIIKNNSL